MLTKNYNEDEKSTRSEVSLDSLVKLEKKLKQLEHCQSLQNSLLLEKLMIKEKNAKNKDKEVKNYDIFSKHAENESFDSFQDTLSVASTNRKNGKWTPEEVFIYSLNTIYITFTDEPY